MTYARSLTILDPTSLLGQEIADRVAVSLADLRTTYMHTVGAEEHLIAEVAGEATIVSPLSDAEELAGTAAVIVTTTPPPELTEALLRWLRNHPEVVLVDASQPGIASEETLTVLGEAPRRAGALRWYHLADPALAAPVLFVAALAPLQPCGLDLTVLRSACGFGQAAIEELAAQGAARLSGTVPGPPRHLPAVLAFDLTPASDEVRGVLERQVRELLPGVESRLAVVETGVFFGHAAVIGLILAKEVSEQQVRGRVRASPHLRLARRNQSVRPTDVVGEDGVLCANLRALGPRVTAWLAADGLRVAGAAAVVDVVTAAIAF